MGAVSDEHIFAALKVGWNRELGVSMASGGDGYEIADSVRSCGRMVPGCALLVVLD